MKTTMTLLSLALGGAMASCPAPSTCQDWNCATWCSCFDESEAYPLCLDDGNNECLCDVNTKMTPADADWGLTLGVGECRAETQHSGAALGTASNTWIMNVRDLPTMGAPNRLWLLNVGQPGTKAQHWLWHTATAGSHAGHAAGSAKIQVGIWNGAQIQGNGISALKVQEAEVIATTYDAETKIQEFYIDGELVASKDFSSSPNQFDLQTNAVKLGKKVGYFRNDLDFVGCVKSAFMFRRTLSSTEIRDVSASLAAPSSTPQPTWETKVQSCRATERYSGDMIGTTSHSWVVDVKDLPTVAAPGNPRQWLLNVGPPGRHALHWLWHTEGDANNHAKIQFGAWAGSQIGSKHQVSVRKFNAAKLLTTTFDATTKTLKFYIDADLVGSEVLSNGAALNIKSNEVRLGNSPWPGHGREKNFAGCVESARMYRTALSATEVAAIAATRV